MSCVRFFGNSLAYYTGADAIPISNLQAYMEAYFDTKVNVLPAVPLPSPPTTLAKHGKAKGVVRSLLSILFG